jgi:uncharacterized protein YlxW (UPF0749 family)
VTVPGIIERFVDDATADDYGSPGGRAGWWAALGALAIGAVVAIGVVDVATTAADRDSTRAALEARVAQADADVQALRSSVDAATAEVDALQADLLAEVDAFAALDQDPLAGQTASLAGAGVTVVIGDAPGAEAGSLNRVLDRDLQDIVNALWRDGARGIAVDDERLTARSAIRSAGEAILVNYRPLSPPYRVTAVGAGEAADTVALLDRLARDYGLQVTVTRGDVALPAAAAPQPRFARAEEGQP